MIKDYGSDRKAALLFMQEGGFNRSCELPYGQFDGAGWLANRAVM